MNHAPVQLGPRELREVYAEPFAAAIRDAGLASIMNSYARSTGCPCAGERRDPRPTSSATSWASTASWWPTTSPCSCCMTHHRTAADQGRGRRAGADGRPRHRAAASRLLRRAAARQRRLLDGTVPMELVDRAAGRVAGVEVPARPVRAALRRRARPRRAASTRRADRALARAAAAASIVLLTQRRATCSRSIVGPATRRGRSARRPTTVACCRATTTTRPIARSSIEGGRRTSTCPKPAGAFSPGPYYTPHVTPLAGSAPRPATRSRSSTREGATSTSDDAAASPMRWRGGDRADVAVGVRRRPVGPAAASRRSARPATPPTSGSPVVQAELVPTVAATGTPTVVVVVSGRVHS